MGIVREQGMQEAASSDIIDVTADYSFGTWVTPSQDNPCFLVVTTNIEGTAGNEAQVTVDIDYSGGTTADESMGTHTVRTYGLTSNPSIVSAESKTIYIPTGASVMISNVLDPNATNSIASILQVNV